MKHPLFTGSATAMVTPFRDGAINYVKMGELLDIQHRSGTAAAVICGTTGENATLSVSETETLFDFCGKHLKNKGMLFIAGIGGNDTAKSLTLAHAAEAAGADGVLMVTPYYNRASQSGLIRHFTYVADRTDLPVILYNVPGRTGICLTTEIYRILSEHPNINGVKEAAGSLSLAARTLAECGENLNFWSGNDDDTVPMMALGAKGVISVASNIVPRVVAELCSLCIDEEFCEASRLYFKYAGLFSSMFCEVNPIPVKTAMNLMGLDVGELRLPLTEMSGENRARLTETLKKYDLL